jgi:DNA-binding NtrC family response regulator
VSASGAAVPEGAVVLESLRIDEAESALIEAALARTEGNRTQAAGLLGISVRTLRSKLNRPD